MIAKGMVKNLQVAFNTSVSIPPIASSPASTIDVEGSSFLVRTSSSSYSSSNCHGFWFDAFLVVPPVVFVVYLAVHAKKNLNKLCNGRSHIMISYYAFLWIASILNLAWCSLQEDYASGVEALARTFIVSGIIVGLDTLLKAIYVFGFGVPLFIDGAGNIDGTKWGLWIIHILLLTAVYGYILFVHFSKWREKLPPRPAFYNYVVVMFVICSVSLLACGLAGLGANFGIWLYNFTLICYHSLYLPFLYVTFLADFFQEEDFLLDSAYYSEMKDAGFFDADWD